MSTHRATVRLALVLAAFAAACTDPGCIRHSECGTGHRCIDAICIELASGIDAGARVDEDAGADSQ